MKTTTLEMEEEFRGESDIQQPRHEIEPAPSREEIEQLAFQFWQERGSPEGSADEDWLRAEQELRRRL